MEEIQKNYIPAAGHDWALPFYDTMMKWLGGDETRRILLKGTGLQPTLSRGSHKANLTWCRNPQSS
jgi:hypothetical protein